MGFAQTTGYVPADIVTLMTSVMTNINTQFGTTYTYATFVGTNFYKYFYALIQELQKNEIKTSEIFQRLQEYFEVTNERISRPVVTGPGLVEKLLSEGYTASVKPPEDADAGKLFVCVDTDDGADDYADVKLAICNILKDSVVAGVVTQGSESESIVLTNGQSFDFKFDLPNRIAPKWRLSTTLSENNTYVIQSPEWQKDRLRENFAARYSLGRNLEPQRYFSLVDAPWASDLVLEYSLDGGSTWLTDVIDAEFDDLYSMDLADITVIES